MEVPMDRTTTAAGSEMNAAPTGPDFLDGFISEGDYAARRGVSIRTCQRDRQLRQAPPYVVIGRLSITASRPYATGSSPANKRLIANPQRRAREEGDERRPGRLRTAMWSARLAPGAGL
jgi:hypothetical protein